MRTGKIQDVAPVDIEYRYEVSQDESGELRVTAYSTEYCWKEPKETELFECALAEMDQYAAKAEAAQ